MSARRAWICALALLAVACTHSTQATTRTHATTPPIQRDLQCPTSTPTPRPTSGDLEREPLAQPAPRDINRGQVRHELVLDNALILAPPRASDHAAYPGTHALCAVLASNTFNNMPVGRPASETMAAGLGRVTIKSSLLHGDSLIGHPEVLATIDGIPSVQAKVPAPSEYSDRLAWVVVVESQESAACPGVGTTAPKSSVEPGHHGYQVFIVDAQTGGDALLYKERENGICPGSVPQGPEVQVPLTHVSVPWTLVSQAPDRTRATISFSVTPCDGYDRVIGVAQPQVDSRVRVIVTRPFGPPCGKAKTATEKLRAPRIGDKLPAQLVPGPTGPAIEG